MKVSELIEALRQFPADADAVMDMTCGCNPQVVQSLFIPGTGVNRYGKHAGVDNEHDVVMSANLPDPGTAPAK